MTRCGLLTKFERGMLVAAAAMTLIALSGAAFAQQAPRAGCVAVTKQEYNNARKSRLQQHRFGSYVRAGRVLKRYYWFCPP